ncbi:hypothetical protein NS220_02090 [Microbacterium testaceum]|uniref:Uncharacterized protein n=1 Tax=Microbacterium testaceum TaxID=2033 RepID=A0A147F166_MICTE|nr:hypothetical protein [Microbacterium testaceum]KTR96487.1 hypothetical protein NS220_02090 [Microbacterium testaceum]
MASRIVKLGYVVFTDVDGRPITGYQGETVDVHDDDLERFDSVNVLPGGDSADAAKILTQVDIDEAVAAALDEKDEELAEARKALDDDIAAFEAAKAQAKDAVAAEVAQLEAAKEELARERGAFDAEKAAAAEPEKKTTARTAAAKQS